MSIDTHKISVKLFVENDIFGPADFVPVFHRWIQDHAIADHLLIDVADYAHVPDGPETLLVAQEANLVMDRSGARLGLLYQRKTALPGTFTQRLAQVLRNAISIATLLEQTPELAGKLKFRKDEIQLKLHDRLAAPNTPETHEAVKADLLLASKEVFGSECQIVSMPASQGLLEMRLMRRA